MEDILGEEKVGFKDLSIWLKILVVFGWISFIIFIIGFLIGFIQGYMYY